jgi:RNA polymerase sigma factor (sigma-70 family)
MTVRDFEACLATNYEPVRRSLAVALGDPGPAEDMAQEAFARAMTRWPSVSAMERPIAWVYVVALNQARRDLRRDERPAAPLEAIPMPDMAGAVVTTLNLETALAALAPRQRAVVVLRYLSDLSVTEVAEAMGCAPGTVKSALHTALARLRVEMKEEEDESTSMTCVSSSPNWRRLSLRPARTRGPPSLSAGTVSGSAPFRSPPPPPPVSPPCCWSARHSTQAGGPCGLRPVPGRPNRSHRAPPVLVERPWTGPRPLRATVVGSSHWCRLRSLHRASPSGLAPYRCADIPASSPSRPPCRSSTRRTISSPCRGTRPRGH